MYSFLGAAYIEIIIMFGAGMKKYLKKILCMILMSTVFISSNANAKQNEDEPEQLYAQSAVLMDADTGRILFGKNENEIRPMASTTKIMTCILVLENMKENQTAVVSDNAVNQPKVRLGVRGKEKYYVMDLLYSLMLESHNDSAVILAEAIAGTEEDFIKMMNEKAKQIGCEHTYFITPNGLDAEDTKGIHSTTAEDLAKIMSYCVLESPKKTEFLSITQTREYQFSDIEATRTFSCNNHNAFLDMMDGAISGKTGFTADAGYCYVGALKSGKRIFVVALLACGWPDNKNYKWHDTRKLMEYGVENYEYHNLWTEWKGKRIPVTDGAERKDVKLQVKGNTKELWILSREDEKISITEELPEQVSAPLKKGAKAGKITYGIDEKSIESFDVVYAEEVVKRNFRWCLEKVVEQWLSI